MKSFLAILVYRGAFMEQPCNHEPVCAFDLAERQAVALKKVRCRAQELERVGFSAIVPPCHVYPEIVLYRTTGLPLCQKSIPDPRDSTLKKNPSCFRIRTPG